MLEKQFVITIARGYGSGGRHIGKALAEELGVHCYDRKLLRLASDESGINEGLFGLADENPSLKMLLPIARRERGGEIIPPDLSLIHIYRKFLPQKSCKITKGSM